MKNSLSVEILLSIIKILPLIVMPFIFLNYSVKTPKFFFQKNQFIKAILPTVWCFSGVENMGFVKKSQKSFFISMTIITIIYILNVWSVFSFCGSFNVGPRIYSEIIQQISGSFGSVILKIIVLIESISNLNSWILSSGLCAYDLSQRNLMPRFIGKQNVYNAPQRAILSGAIGLLALIIISQNSKAGEIITRFTMVSCNLFLVFYSFFALACFLEEKTITSLFVFFICLCVCVASQNAFSLVVTFLIMTSGLIVFMPFNLLIHQ